jgi:peptidoglycan/xylan/chitin deacetylase (PgdA/CDA1 family)
MKPSPNTIIQKVTKRLEPGAMILMHPTEPSSLALESIIKEVKRRGFVVGTVSELISSDRVQAVQTFINNR